MSADFWAPLIVAAISLISSVTVAIIILVKDRKNSQDDRATADDANHIDRFQALLAAQKTVFDEQVAALQGQINALRVELETVKAIDRAKTIELQKLREAVQRWFRSLRAAWKQATDQPMPYPSDVDMELLGITVER